MLTLGGRGKHLSTGWGSRPCQHVILLSGCIHHLSQSHIRDLQQAASWRGAQQLMRGHAACVARQNSMAQEAQQRSGAVELGGCKCGT